VRILNTEDFWKSPIAIRIEADSLLVLKKMVVPAIPDAPSLSNLPASSTGVTAGSPARPWTPACSRG